MCSDNEYLMDVELGQYDLDKANQFDETIIRLYLQIFTGAKFGRKSRHDSYTHCSVQYSVLILRGVRTPESPEHNTILERSRSTNLPVCIRYFKPLNFSTSPCDNRNTLGSRFSGWSQVQVGNQRNNHIALDQDIRDSDTLRASSSFFVLGIGTFCGVTCVA
ncbi:hypothetical protein PM082_024591 [Marasmius tenuissimus]|nr:hypothetical protein PM082_024591 [Marasmius tenuissimus]